MADFSQYGGKSNEWIALERTLPAPPSDISPEELKRTTNETRLGSAQEEMKILRPKVLTQDFRISTRDQSTIEARTYRPSSIPPTQKLPIYVHFHGGGFFFGTIGSEDATCTRLALDVGVVVVNINYRHTPEAAYPVAWNDAEDAFQWVYTNSETLFAGDNMKIVVGGVSAGAYLTASLMLKLALDESSSRMGVQGAVYMIPPLVHHEHYQPYLDQLKDPKLSSWKENESAPVLPVSRIEFFNSMLFPDGPPSKDDRRANPGLATVEEVQKLPPATFGICGLDPLRDEGLLFAKMLSENGIPVNVNLFKGVPHAYRMFGDKLPNASRAWDVVMHEGVRWALASPKVSKNDVNVPSSELPIHVWQS